MVRAEAVSSAPDNVLAACCLQAYLIMHIYWYVLFVWKSFGQSSKVCWAYLFFRVCRKAVCLRLHMLHLRFHMQGPIELAVYELQCQLNTPCMWLLLHYSLHM